MQLMLIASNEHIYGCLDISACGVHSRDYSRVPGALELVKLIPMVRQLVGLECLDVDPWSIRTEHDRREARVRAPQPAATSRPCT